MPPLPQNPPQLLMTETRAWGVGTVEAWDAEESDVAYLFPGGAAAGGRGRTLSACLEAGLGLGSVFRREQLVALGDGELLVPEVALLVGGDEVLGHLVLGRGGGLEAAASDLGDVGSGLGGEGEGLISGRLVRTLAGGLVDRGVDLVGFSGSGSAARLVERVGGGEVGDGRR